MKTLYVIEIKNLVKNYVMGDIQVRPLGINLTIDRNECVAIRGSGIGNQPL